MRPKTALTASGVPATIVRATAFLELWIELLRRTAGRSNRPLVFGRGQNPINFVSVRDVAALVDHVVADSATRGQTLQLGGPDNLTLNQLAGMVAADGGEAGDRLDTFPGQRCMRWPPPSAGSVRNSVGRPARPWSWTTTT